MDKPSTLTAVEVGEDLRLLVGGGESRVSVGMGPDDAVWLAQALVRRVACYRAVTPGANDGELQRSLAQSHAWLDLAAKEVERIMGSHMAATTTIN